MAGPTVRREQPLAGRDEKRQCTSLVMHCAWLTTPARALVAETGCGGVPAS